MAPVLQPLPVTSVLFACTYNMIRSPMAAAIMRHFHGTRVYVDSVGVREGDEVDPFAVAVMEEMGIDLSRHRCRSFEDLEDTNFDLIVSLSPEAQHRAIEMTRTMACEVEFWNTFDPTLVDGNREAMLEAYRKVRDGLLGRIKERFPLSRGPTV
ncbi:low molecular weight phosphatase family protein [Azospirillum brasilense]|jgi:protein-tyrosine-phosphatase|uniref:Low molecular weight phosphatase family protein n=1 Tax=Azospirillum brasilense TaxID=192 RepID=A0A4D8QMC8_AZOBR|nr:MULTISPECIES: low molecular weight phosphatase family protein [Azospirillum]MDW7556545.1 low molecular weight phosphatase family protein [Azospirillum brasilense]MDW7592545.1 low molecular weight phosphatase family protein [Azospirillum brasilense]MDW7628075.1 low molecular weight phosphatase family protein [Azospirillum brasilense]MDX5952013.1 low molecular weight phosphatase family protein [Azospirillum brasilense]NUB11858.1 low molecular weight phosphatase family protein [Azospirillum br